MKRLIPKISLGGALWGAAPQTYPGMITDTLCGAQHDMKGNSDVECAEMCAKSPGQFALFDGQKVVKLSDQKTPAKYAEQKMKVAGTLDAKANAIKVLSIEPATDY